MEKLIAFECECQCCLEPCMHACLWSTPALGSPGLLRGHERGMLFNGIVRAVGHNFWALGVSGEGGHVSLQAEVSGFLLCRLVSWIQPRPEWARQGGCEGCVKAGSLLPCQMEPGSLLQPALEGDNHERDNGLFRVNRS